MLPTQQGLGQRAEHQHWDFSQICSCQKPPLPNDSYLKEEKARIGWETWTELQLG